MLFHLVPETRSLGLQRPSELKFGRVVVQSWVAPVLRRIVFHGIRVRCWKRTSLWLELSLPLVRWLVLLVEREKCALEGETQCFQCRKVVCQRMRLLPVLQGHFLFASKTVSSPDRFSENGSVWNCARPLLQWNPMRSSIKTSLIVPCGHKLDDLATRNLVQPPEPLDKMDERLGDFQFNHRVQKCSFELTLLPQCV